MRVAGTTWFDTAGFMPHGHCYLWTPSLVGMHASSDILIGLAYLVIPVGLYVLHRRRPDLDFNLLFVSFSLFIVACGFTHWLEAWNIWHAEYWVEGAVKVVTAALSIPTAILLWRALPKLIALPSHAALTRANEDKAVLLKEIHHRVKNNLAVISSLFYLQSTYTEEEPVLAILQQSQDRVRAMSLVHEALYRSDSVADVDLAEYAGALCTQLVSTYSAPDARVTLTSDLETVRSPLGLAIPCGLILNELVTNALKHAFGPGEAGAIHVSLHRAADGQSVLCVEDTGRGLPPDSAPSRSLGLRLVRLMAKQIDATFELKARHPGTQAQLSWHMPFP